MAFGFGFGFAKNYAVSAWSPTSLFVFGEQGVWYDPSDMTTLFQDSAGTTPVTAVEQPVGLLLDKSKGLVLGPELVVNGTNLVSTAGWTQADANSVFTAVSGRLRLTSPNAAVALGYQILTTVVGKTYKVSVTAYAGTGTSRVLVGITGGNGSLFSETASSVSSRQVNIFFTATTTTSYLQFTQSTATSGLYTEFSNISVRELPGNHATQATSTKRPVLSARVNLLTKTEDFSDAVWSKSNATVTANAVAAPDGTTTADKLVENIATSSHQSTSNNLLSFTSGVSYALSFYVKQGGRSRLNVQADTGLSTFPATANALYDLSNGAVVSVGASATASITDVGGGWYRCVLVATATATTANRPGYYFMLVSTGTTTTYTGDGTSGIYIWGASLVPADQASLPYQRVNTATDYDTVGFKHYLKFDGVDDALATGTIDFTATDKMTVVAGVRKLSDAAQGTIVELTTSVDSVANGFTLRGPNSALNSYMTEERGSAYSTAVITQSAPDTAVISAIFQQQTPFVSLRRNAGSYTNSTTNPNIPAYANAALYIGSRAGISLPFNGHLYSLLIRGAQSTDAQIVSAETYVNSKTGAY